MRWIRATALACVLFSSLAGADTVYVRDGKSYSGKVTVEGQKVLIDTGSGVVEVKLKEVVHISRKAPPGNATTRPKSSVPGTRASVRVYSIEDVTSPEPIVFMLMRQLEGMSPGMSSYRIRKQIEQWQIAAHEQKRKANGKWVAPKYFVARRKSYEKTVKECEELAARLRGMRTRTKGQKATLLAMKRKLGTKLTEAARIWADPQIRSFLTGVAEFRSEEFARAEMHFRKCAAEAPRVAAYHQGHGMALLALKRPTDALAAFVKMLSLKPESSLAVRLVSQTVKKVPGMHTKKAVYKEATAMLSEYPQASAYRKRSGGGTTWLMPGKRPWEDRHDTLPVPSYDRLLFRQAVGVPIGKRTLLVDKAAVEGAIELAVQIDGKTVVPGIARRLLQYRTKEEPLPLAMVSVDGYEFSSTVGEIQPRIGTSKKKEAPGPRFAAGTDVTIYCLGLYEEMGGAVRQTRGRIKSVKAGGETELSGSLLPGDACGPVLTHEGELVGFLTGRMDASAPAGGKSEFMDRLRIEPLILRARRGSRVYRTYTGYGRAVRKIRPKQIESEVFVVHAVFGERLQ